jgi:HK97 family phage prohead protease
MPTPFTRQRIATPSDLLRERRSSMRDSMRGQRERHRQAAEVELRAKPNGTGGTSFEFNGYAATFEQPFEMWDFWGDLYYEVLGDGACNRTLANQCDTQFLVGHNEAGIPLARTKSGTMNLSSDSHGLEVNVPSLDGANPMVQALASAMERRDMDEMSIGFISTAQAWSPDWMERRITEINLNRGDVSMVCWGANPNTAGASMTAVPVSEAAARQAGAGRERRTPTAPYSAKAGEGNQCPQCQSMNDSDAAYCDQCGTAVRSTGASTAEENETQRCPCGAWNADDAKFCDQCGTNIASDRDADNGGTGNGPTEAPSGYWDWKAGRRGEQRADAAPDFSGKPPQDTSAHGDGSLPCPNDDCGAPNAQDAAFCDQCGTCLYDDNGLITNGELDDNITDESGMVEEEDMTLARQRRARYLALSAP